MRLTIEYNDDEAHVAKWCLVRCASILGCNIDNNEIKYEHGVSISNIWNVPEQFREALLDTFKRTGLEGEE